MRRLTSVLHLSHWWEHLWKILLEHHLLWLLDWHWLHWYLHLLTALDHVEVHGGHLRLLHLHLGHLHWWHLHLGHLHWHELLRWHVEHWLLHLNWSHEVLWLQIVSVTVEYVLTFNLTKTAHVANLSVREVAVEAFLTSPVSESILWLSIILIFLLHDSIVKMMSVLGTIVLLADLSFIRSLGFFNVFGIHLCNVFIFMFIVNEFATMTFFPFFEVLTGALFALPAIFWN
jgi:hypothetical protein